LDRYQSLVVEEPEPGIALVTLNRPERLNAFDLAMVDEIHALLTRLEQENAIRVLVVTGAGRGFCAGTDLKASRAGDGAAISVSKQMRSQRHIADMVLHLRRIPQPVIAAINGVAAGGGLSLAMAADIRVAAQGARFVCSYINVGLSAGEIGSSYFLPRLVGLSRAADLLYTGRTMDADEAARIGFVSRVVPDGEAAKAGLDIARVMIEKSPFGLRMTKEVLNHSIDAPSLEAALFMENRTQTLAVMSGDFREGAAAFKEKRKPVYDSES
jgi:enoyl-CoA hydratase/carnithine racemase